MREAPLGDLLSTLIDYRGRTPKKSDSGIPLITAKVIKNGRITSSRAEFIPEKTYSTWMRRGIPRRGDILVTTEAPLGEVAQIKTDERVALAQRVILLRVDASRVNPQFVLHFLRSDEGRSRMRQRSSGTTVSGIRQPELLAVRIPLLPTRQQAGASAILDALDELIEINERRIELLEELARSLYREWFVRFRFPGHADWHLNHAALGRCPDGWMVSRLGDVATLNRYTVRATELPDSMLYLDISALSPRRVGHALRTSAASAPGRARRRASDGDTLWATVRPNRRAHALLHDPPDNLILSNGLAVITPETVPSSYLFEYTSSIEFTDYLVSRATGAAYPAVRPVDFEDAPMSIPPPELLHRFDRLVQPAHRLVSALTASNSRLAAARDLFLPRLVTGRLDISDIDLGDLLPVETA